MITLNLNGVVTFRNDAVDVMMLPSRMRTGSAQNRVRRQSNQ